MCGVPAQDLALHMDEVYTKLVDIMQDRLAVAARQLTAESEAWGGKPGGLSAAGQAVYTPSECIRQLSKQLGTLRSVLSPILQPDEVRALRQGVKAWRDGAQPWALR